MIVTKEEYSYRNIYIPEEEICENTEVCRYESKNWMFTEGKISDFIHALKLKKQEKDKATANANYGSIVSIYRKDLENILKYGENVNKLFYDFCLSVYNGKPFETEVKSYRDKRNNLSKIAFSDKETMALSNSLNTKEFANACKKSPDIMKDLEALSKDCNYPGKYIKRKNKIADAVRKTYTLLEKIEGEEKCSEEACKWITDEYNLFVDDFEYIQIRALTPYAVYNKINNIKVESSITDEKTFDPSKYFSFQDEDKVNPSLFDDEKVFYRDPVYNKAITEYFNMTDRKTTKVLTRLNEAGQNTVLMNLTSKLYDKIVSKCDDIDYGEIPATKGDITKLSKYNDMKETISIMHDILKEYNQDTGPVDELSVALSNVEARKDLFERAYRYNSELPIAMYCNVVLGIITGISYMIATSIEFIKDPGTESFRLALDKMSYAKTKDHMIYSTLKSFNKTCANKDFDRAMEAVLKASTKNFTGGVVLGGIAIGILGVILVLIPVLRELIFLFYYTRMRISDFFDIQADLLQANAYALESNTTLNKTEQKKVMAKQLKTVEHFRKISNAFAIEIKKAEVASAKEKRQDDETKMLIDDIDGLDSSSGSALF